MLNGITCYKAGVPKTAEEASKKVNMLGLKVDEPTRLELQKIHKAEDRPLGYIARELMLRGLAQYKRDGRLKEPPIEAHPGDTLDVPTIDLKKRQEKQQKRRA